MIHRVALVTSGAAVEYTAPLSEPVPWGLLQARLGRGATQNWRLELTPVPSFCRTELRGWRSHLQTSGRQFLEGQSLSLSLDPPICGPAPGDSRSVAYVCLLSIQ